MAVTGEVKQAFDELQAFVGGYDPVSLLSQLTLTFLVVPAEEFQGEASDVVTWQRRIEFLAGYLLVRPYQSRRNERVDGGALEHAEKRLERYFDAIQRAMIGDATQHQDDSGEAMVLAQAKIESLYVRGDAYPHQFYTFARDLYGPHDAWFRKRYCFSIVEAIDLSHAIHRICDERINESLHWAREEARSRTDEMIGRQEVTEAERKNVETAIGRAALRELRDVTWLHFGQSLTILRHSGSNVRRFS